MGDTEGLDAWLDLTGTDRQAQTREVYPGALSQLCQHAGKGNGETWKRHCFQEGKRWEFSKAILNTTLRNSQMLGHRLIGNILLFLFDDGAGPGEPIPILLVKKCKGRAFTVGWSIGADEESYHVAVSALPCTQLWVHSGALSQGWLLLSFSVSIDHASSYLCKPSPTRPTLTVRHRVRPTHARPAVTSQHSVTCKPLTRTLRTLQRA